MISKIQLLTALCLLLLSCRQPAATDATGSVPANELQTIITKYGYSDAGWNSLNTLYKKKTHTDAPSVLAYYNFALNYFNNKLDYKRGMAYADSMLRLVNKPEYENTFYKERANANINKAHSLYFLKQYKDCYYYYYNGSVEAAKINDSALTANLNQQMCIFLFEEGNYSKAIYYYKQLLVDVAGNNKTYERLMNNQGIQDNIGLSFLKDKNADSATAYFKAAIQSINDAVLINSKEETLCQTALGVVYGNLAQAYTYQKHYDSAEVLYKQSIAINTQPGYANEDALITQQHLADLYYEVKNIPLFYTTLKAMEKGLDTIPNKKVELCWNVLMDRYYVVTQQPARALAYLEKYMQLRDSARNAQPATGNNADIFDQMKIMQSKYEMSLLKKDNQMSKIYLYVTIVLLLLALVIAILTFSFLRKSKKNVSVLTTLNNKINHKQILLEDTLAHLEKENREKQHILHVVAHDLRNPIAAIHTLATMTENEYADEDSARENLELIKNACTESSELISGILEIAENEEMKYVCQPVDVNTLLSHSLSLLRMKAKEKNQRITLLVPGEKGYVYADADKMNRVLSNIITNAIKFSPAGSLIEVTAVTLEEHITIQIEDNGIGIPDKYRNHIFDAFTEAKRSGTEGEKTFGLGLSISKQIIEKHHGTIWFESKENEGTTFFIRLPRLKDVLMIAADMMAPGNRSVISR